MGVGLRLYGQRILCNLEDHLKEGLWALSLGKHRLEARGRPSWWKEAFQEPSPLLSGVTPVFPTLLTVVVVV